MKAYRRQYAGMLAATVAACVGFGACNDPDSDGEAVARGCAGEQSGGASDEPSRGEGAEAGVASGNAGAGGDGHSQNGGGDGGAGRAEAGAAAIGAGGEAGSSPLEAPEVIQVTPGDGAEDAEPAGSVTVHFSRVMDPTTLTSDNIQLNEGANGVHGSLTCSSVQCLFKPSERLALLGRYEVSVSAAVRAVDGTPLAHPFSSQFTVRDGVWTDVTEPYGDGEWLGAPRSGTRGTDYTVFGLDERGSALFIWALQSVKSGYSFYELFARRYSIDSGWDPIFKVGEQGRNSVDTGHVFEFRAAADRNGDAVVAWTKEEYDPKFQSIYRKSIVARRYIDGAWEAAPQSLAVTAWSETTNLSVVDVAMGGGQVVVLGSDATGNWASSSTSLGSWPTTVERPQIRTRPFGTSSLFAFLVSPTGDATLGSSDAQSGPVPVDMYLTAKPAGQSWQAPKVVPELQQFPHLVLAGDTIVASFFDGDCRVTHSTQPGGFAPPEILATPTPDQYGDVYPCDLKGGPNAAFLDWVDPTNNSVYVKRFDPQTATWGADPFFVHQGGSDVVSVNDIVEDARGNACAFFNESVENGWSVLRSFRYDKRAGVWSAQSVPEAGHHFLSTASLVAPNGVIALVLWDQFFLPYDPTRPRILMFK